MIIPLKRPSNSLTVNDCLERLALFYKNAYHFPQNTIDNFIQALVTLCASINYNGSISRDEEQYLVSLYKRTNGKVLFHIDFLLSALSHKASGNKSYNKFSEEINLLHRKGYTYLKKINLQHATQMDCDNYTITQESLEKHLANFCQAFFQDDVIQLYSPTNICIDSLHHDETRPSITASLMPLRVIKCIYSQHKPLSNANKAEPIAYLIRPEFSSLNSSINSVRIHGHQNYNRYAVELARPPRKDEVLIIDVSLYSNVHSFLAKSDEISVIQFGRKAINKLAKARLYPASLQ